MTVRLQYALLDLRFNLSAFDSSVVEEIRSEYDNLDDRDSVSASSELVSQPPSPPASPASDSFSKGTCEIGVTVIATMDSSAALEAFLKVLAERCPQGCLLSVPIATKAFEQ